ncbi:MAG: addiction module protein [Polyangia bacterium]|jgi:putative addiction module component (TIGR02574 family)|nr:addiction module protein [Polyangia bacterium]
MSQAKHSSSYDELSVPERIELLQRLWDELAASPEEIGLTEAQRAELDRRLEDYRRDPDAGVSWESLRDSLHRAP